MSGTRRFPALFLALFIPWSEAAVRFVDPAHPAASDAGAGSAERPFRTLAGAIRKLRPGDTLKIAPGVYREALVFPETDWSGGTTLIEPAARGEVLIKGSDLVTGWEPLGAGLYVKRPWPVNSQQVFVDGIPLRQVGGTIYGGYPEKPDHPMAKLHAGQGGIWPGRVAGGLEKMTDDSFYYDAGTQALYIKVPLASLEGRAIEVSVRPHLVFGQRLENVTLRNLRFRHANTTALNQTGAITLTGNRLVLENIEVTHVDGNGFDVTGDEITIMNSRANYCGQVGMKVRGRGNRLIGNETSFNNTRGFNKWWEAGGAKFVGGGGLRDSEVAGHRALANNGDGIWFDWMNSNNRIHGNVSAYNAGMGIHYEASRKGYIYNNFVFANRQRGIYLPHSSDSVIAHNLVARNALEGIAIVEEERGKGRAELRPRGNRVLANILAWNGKAAIVLPSGLLDNASDYNLILGDGEPPVFSLGWGSRQSPVARGLDRWRAASGQDLNSWYERMEVPQDLLEALRNQRPDPDWAPVLALASRLSIRAPDAPGKELSLPVAVQTRPGPER